MLFFSSKTSNTCQIRAEVRHKLLTFLSLPLIEHFNPIITLKYSTNTKSLKHDTLLWVKLKI